MRPGSSGPPDPRGKSDERGHRQERPTRNDSGDRGIPNNPHSIRLFDRFIEWRPMVPEDGPRRVPWPGFAVSAVYVRSERPRHCPETVRDCPIANDGNALVVWNPGFGIQFSASPRRGSARSMSKSPVDVGRKPCPPGKISCETRAIRYGTGASKWRILTRPSAWNFGPEPGGLVGRQESVVDTSTLTFAMRPSELQLVLSIVSNRPLLGKGV